MESAFSQRLQAQSGFKRAGGRTPAPVRNARTTHTRTQTHTQLDYEAAEPAIMSAHGIMPIMSRDAL